MGTIDIRIKNFIKINSVFAQLFSVGVFGGRLKIEPDGLRELDTANQKTVRLEDGQLRDIERLRDVQKISMLFDDRIAFQVIMGVEGQDGVNYFMPVRCMELDALTYSFQCRRISEKAKERKELKKICGRSAKRHEDSAHGNACILFRRRAMGRSGECI